jgi:hypothetical protein
VKPRERKVIKMEDNPEAACPDERSDFGRLNFSEVEFQIPKNRKNRKV